MPNEVALTFTPSSEKRVLAEGDERIAAGETFHVTPERAEELLAAFPGELVEAAGSTHEKKVEKDTTSTPHSPQGTADPARTERNAR
jgi:hypothetical protein